MSPPTVRRRRNRPRKRVGSGSGDQPLHNQPKINPLEFWGESSDLHDRISGLSHSPNVQAVLNSLGRPPLTGSETAAEHWFSLVYERAAFLAGALAAAGDLTGDQDADR